MAASQPQIETFTGTRITITTPHSFNDTIQKLYTEIGFPKNAAWPTIAASIKTFDESSKQAFIAATEKAVGAKGFMVFLELNHGTWLPLFNVGSGLQLKRIILGNPLIAITMLEHDLKAGLAVPVELLVRELGEGRGTELSYQLPSSLVVGASGDEKLLGA
ncbi:hypothetical protein LSUE1_G004879, partial [Lachnellula suecica]